jgi:ferric-dicitrate binding protein FerR (iron transport regulator)
MAACIVGLVFVSSLFLFLGEDKEQAIAKVSTKNSDASAETPRATEEKEPNTDAVNVLPFEKTRDSSRPAKNERPVLPINPEKFITFQADKEKTVVRLPDSSVVFLNRNSKIYYKEDFNQKERIVKFEGEGFFEITKNSQKPFIIESNNSITKVVGTSFNLRTYVDEKLDEIDVVTGRVEYSLKDLSRALILTVGQKGTISLEGSVLNLSKSESTDMNFMAWKTNKLAFQKSNFEIVLATLERHFNVRVKASNPDILKCTFSGTFKNPNLKEILEVITLTRKITYSKDGEEYILSGEGCK